MHIYNDVQQRQGGGSKKSEPFLIGKKCRHCCSSDQHGQLVDSPALPRFRYPIQSFAKQPVPRLLAIQISQSNPGVPRQGYDPSQIVPSPSPPSNVHCCLDNWTVRPSFQTIELYQKKARVKIHISFAFGFWQSQLKSRHWMFCADAQHLQTEDTK